MNKTHVLVVILLIISSLVLAGCSSQPSDKTQATVSPSIQTTQATIPATNQTTAKISSDLDFRLNDTNGQPVLLSSFSGKVILLNFWATWCGPCTGEMPLLQELNLDWSNRNDAVLLTINMAESAGTVRSFLQSNNYNFRVLLDSQSKVSNKYQVQYIPTSILIGQDGEIKFRIVGPFKDKAAILKAIGDNLPQ